ncbi:MAG: DsbA family protein [Acidimicrobiales bacterium]
MNVPRLLAPAAVFAAAAALVAATFLTGDDPALVDTANVVTTTTGSAETGASDTAGPPSPTAEAPPDGPSRARMAPLQVANESMTIGDPNAPLIMVTFESFGCGWCGHFHQLTMPQVVENWVDTGQLRIESRMMPYEERATPGALAGVAAGMQGKYWELADIMYPYITAGGEPLFDRDPTDAEMDAYHERQSEAAMLAEVEAAAPTIGLDYERFVTDFRSPEAMASMQTDTQLGYALGFTGTPAIVVNGVPLGGFASYERFDEFLVSVLDATVDKP